MLFTEGTVLDVVLGFPALLIAIYYMAEWGHDREIYLIWYIESFFFLLFYGIGVFAEIQMLIPQSSVRLSRKRANLSINISPLSTTKSV
jgi:hypothetical protein